MRASNDRLTIFSDETRSALYDLPEFDSSLREEYLILTDDEIVLALSRLGLAAQIYCTLQIAYFKAKQFFFNFTLKEVNKDDLHFILEHYFSSIKLKQFVVSDYEFFEQRRLITAQFGYRRWSTEYKPILQNHLQILVRRDITLDFLIMELLAFLQQEKIIRPSHTTLQKMISLALTEERKRLADIIHQHLNNKEKLQWQILLNKEDTLSKLALLKQDAKGLKPQMLDIERQKFNLLRPLYGTAKLIIPKLMLSQ